MIHSVKCNADCIGCGNCERTCKAIFRLTYSVHAEAVGHNYEKHQKQLLSAYYDCPVQAIEMDSDDPAVQIAWYKALIVEKRKLSDTVMEIQLQSTQNDFVPGQYITVRFKDDIGYFNRAYSIVEFKDGIITLCVTLLHGGRGSSFFVNYDVGDEVEVEGRGRDQISTTDSEPGLGSLTLRATDIWSATINVWRDYQPYESLGFYAGGGLGSGGYRSTISGTGLASAYTGNDPVTNFAWQAGGGVFYNLSERATIDLGYRFFAIDESTAVAEVFQQPFTYRERYSASELLLTLRIYEPFQRWW